MNNFRRTSILEETNATLGSPSFYMDAESTLSSGDAFKTVDEFGEFDMNDDGYFDKCAEQMLNKTEGVEDKLPPAVQKSFFKNFKPHSSTPTQEQVFRSIEIKRGSEMEESLASLARFATDDSKFFSSPTPKKGKENTLPEAGDSSTLCESPSVGAAVSLIERKMMNLSTGDRVLQQSLSVKNDSNRMTGGEAAPEDSDVLSPPLSGRRYSGRKTGDGVLSKRKLSVESAPKIPRKPICEPNLAANRPSRIVSKIRPQTFDMKSRKSVALKNKDKDNMQGIPKLTVNSISVDDNASDADAITSAQKSSKTPATGIRSRQSLLPTLQQEKRPYNFKSRMSVVVKTTLNSPARKLQRKITTPNQLQKRRTMAVTATDILAAAEARRNSLIPKKVSSNKATAKKEITSNTKKPIQKTFSIPKTNALTEEYLCGVCGNKYRIKSLLDAHKRSHEEDIPSFMKKAAMNTIHPNSVIDTDKQCKYCDKKFALSRTLHIHLLQNCPKIPPAEKRKLQFTELQHEQKAQLPTFGNIQQLAPLLTTSQQQIANTGAIKKKNADPPIAVSVVSSGSDSSIQLGEKLSKVFTEMGPPISKKGIKKSMAHSGVYRTPTKAIFCHSCKQKFKTVVEFTDHCITVHVQSGISKSAENVTDQVNIN